MQPTLAPLKLKKREDRRLRAGHLWIFSNEVDIQATPLVDLAPGQDVEIHSADGTPIATAYVNPGSLICARVISRDLKYRLDRSLIKHRLNIALSLRERLFAQPFYRLCFGESDGLPGLVVDRYGDVLVVQINTAGMEQHRDDLIDALNSVIKPAVIVFKNDGSMRKLEGLETYVETVVGDERPSVEISENGVRFMVPILDGQKTGWFYDQYDNRTNLWRYVSGARVLDVFSYIGAWGVQAAVAGASEVMCVDASAVALDRVHENAQLNAVDERVSTLQGDAFEALSELRASREQFDVVIVDPPAFIKRRKDKKKGLQAYSRINQLAIRLLSRDGLLVSASCSSHLSRDDLGGLLHQSARHIDRDLTILQQGHQAADHPIHPAIPETEYLKSYLCRVLPR
ncbi:MAG TPA: class I SAM-dependent rRNA methyltransferase [Chromatiaceae bacterium]|jgi:23S rRNA (cytosine1962-C5)-methyltransferase|nr:class I SAM-dependent rRNA methyltransferase [Chromatiaceae bacterium]HIN81732.1 class I SAM-dependent rRNA methyltransferase [Chromatiales bacterium]HIA07847.1 class I SAM-dependent rRNA methyltransferase [Chromatiaceae bacterium]HIB84461.1 class I SAM-dependent rRNA methyltransferase [Chromatiaceae bacterium]HIO14892.1 class I SAM-dependent rRNA methyltransferase [Chromatiales bacterium]